jgi:hypothetical protein
MVSYRYLPIERRAVDAGLLLKDIRRFERSSEEDLPSEALKAKNRELCQLNRGLRDPAVVERMRFWMAEIRRIVGATVFALSAFALAMLSWSFEAKIDSIWRSPLALGAIGMAVCTVLFYVFVRFRRDVMVSITLGFLRPDWLRDYKEADSRIRWAKRVQALLPFLRRDPGRLRKFLASVFTVESPDDLQRRWRWYSLCELRWNTKGWLLVFTIFPMLAFLWELCYPVGFGVRFGPFGVIIFALSFWMMLRTWVIFWLDHRRFPVITSVFVWAFLASFFTFGDNHGVRTIARAETTAIKPGHRVSVAKAVEGWRGEASPSPSASSSGHAEVVLTPIIVASAGGGIRAAYWTAITLAKMHEDPLFHSNLFAISAVSGGALGAAAYEAALSDLKDRNTFCPEDNRTGKELGQVVREFLAKDFLAPTLASLLGGDMLARLVPVRLIPDRAEALERSWERAWPVACAGGQSRFAEAFLDLWPKDGNSVVRHHPAYMINGTLIHTGARIITSNLVISPDVFREAHDFYAFVGSEEIALSTAVHNGARFTYVSPAGPLYAQLDLNGRKVMTGQIIDGGYFENFGAETASDLLIALCEVLRCSQIQSATPNGNERDAPPAPRIHPIVIQISSDPELPNTALEENEQPKKLSSLEHYSEVWAPIRGFQNTRDARGINAMKRLHYLVEKRYGGTFAHLRLCTLDDREEPPLGWVLSDAAQETIDRHLKQPCTEPVKHDNNAEIERVKYALCRGVRCERGEQCRCG